MKVLIDRRLTPAVGRSVKKRRVGDWRWSLDNIGWPLRAAETISLHGATLLLLSCLDTFFFFSLSHSSLSSVSVSLSVSGECSFCELAACIWSWSNLLVAIRKWCAQSFAIVLFLTAQSDAHRDWVGGKFWLLIEGKHVSLLIWNISNKLRTSAGGDRQWTLVNFCFLVMCCLFCLL